MPSIPDKFPKQDIYRAHPPENHFAITPGDPLASVTRAIYVGESGDLQVKLVGTVAPLVYKNVQAGTQLVMAAEEVLGTLTTAGSLIGQY